jgi:Ca-activated chloride channel family protein
MTFERPDLLVVVPAVVTILLLAVVLQWMRGVRLVRAYGGSEPAQRLLGRRLESFPVARTLVLVLVGSGLALAAAGPSRESSEPIEPPTPVDLIVAIDVSHSMTAADVDPSRVARARDALDRILEEGVADRVSLTLFADWPFGLVPLTDDADVISFFSPWIAPELVSTRDQGTSLAAVFGHTRAVWEARPRNDGEPIVLIISDGEAHGSDPDVLDSVAVATEAGMRIWTAGVGTPQGAPLFVAGSEGAPVLDTDGRIVIAEFGPELLQSMAARGDGIYHDISTDGGIRSLVSALRRESGPSDTTADLPADPVFWLFLACLGLLIVEAALDSGVLGRRAGSEREARDAETTHGPASTARARAA